MRTLFITLMAISLSGCGPKPDPNPVPPDDDPIVSLLSVSDARSKYNALTDNAERYRQVLISQRTLGNIASLELNNALREWNDPFLDPLAKDSVRTRTWDAIKRMEQAISDYAPAGMNLQTSGRPRSKSSMTPQSAKDWHIALKRQFNQYRDEHLGRRTLISSSRNKTETSIDEWEANMDAPDIAIFFQSEAGEYLGELTQIVSRYRPSRGG